MTVQQVLEDALGKILGHRVPTHGASRTDAGVHALGQCVHFDVPHSERLLCGQEILNALNANLCAATRVFEIRVVEKDFHAQFSAIGKTYCYRLCNLKILPPLSLGRCWHVIKPLDIDAMRRAAHYLIGQKNFGVFAVNSKTTRANTIRRIDACEIIPSSGSVWVRVSGDGFLYKMVRGIVGALVSVGRGKAPPDWIVEILDTQRRDPLQITAPACGLCLMAVHYKRWYCGEKKLTWF